MIQQQSIRNDWVILALGIIGLLVHGPQAGRLGLYWDESITFLRAMQNVEGDVIRFILKDAQGFLPSERPLAYFPYVVSRAGFAVSLPLAHWISVVLLVLTAVLLAMLAYRIVNEKWFSFSVGVIFLTYPLSPLQAIWMTATFYIWAAILALFAMLLFLRGLKAKGKEQLPYFVLAVLLYLASVLTHEEFILIPPIFVALHLLSKAEQKGSNWKLLGPIANWRPAAYGLGLFLLPMAAYALWRVMILPSYGYQIYSTGRMVLATLAQKFLIGIKTAFLPMDDALRQILVEFPPEPGYIFLSAIVSLAVWVIVLSLHSTVARQEPSQENPWPRAAICGAVLAISGIVFLTVSPVYIGGVVGTGWSSRVNFVMTFGAAVALPGFLGLLVSSYNRFTPLAGLLGIAFLIYIGFTTSVLDMEKLFRLSTLFTALRYYSLKHSLAIMGFVILTTLLILMIILSSVLQLRRRKRLPTDDRLVALYSRMCSHFLAGIVAGLVLLGSLFHFSTKEQYIGKWDQHKSMLEQLQRLAHSLKDDTFVIMIRDRNDPVSPSHREFSNYLMALYGNKSITGNMDWQLRFHADRVDSTYRGRITHSRVPYDRLLLFEFDGRNLRMLPKVEVKTEEGVSLVVRNNPDRILSGSTVRTAVWRYLN